MLCLGTKSESAHSDGSMISHMREGVREEGGTNPEDAGSNLLFCPFVARELHDIGNNWTEGAGGHPWIRHCMEFPFSNLSICDQKLDVFNYLSQVAAVRNTSSM